LWIAGGGFLASLTALTAGELRIEYAQTCVARPLDIDVE
jgi:hypothetical protein